MRAGTTRLDVPSVKVDVADTIGAGDPIMGALLTEIARRHLTRELKDAHEVLEKAAQSRPETNKLADVRTNEVNAWPERWCRC